MDKQGQGLSLNVIIIAAIALVVMVVLIAIFIGRTGGLADKIAEEADSELYSMTPTYGVCKPSVTSEVTFKTEFGLAATLEDTQEQMIKKAEAKSKFKDEIERCRGVGEKSSCTDSGCRWGS